MAKRPDAPSRKVGKVKKPVEVEEVIEEVIEVKKDKKKKKKEVVVEAEEVSTALVPSKGSASTAVVRSASTGGKRGLENVEQEDLTIPYLKILQGMSPEVMDGDGKPGQLVNSLTGYTYPEELYFIPLMFTKRRIFWYDRNDKENTGMRCASINSKVPDTGKKYSAVCGNCQYAQWGQGGEPPQCSVIFSFPSLVLMLPEGEEGNKLISTSFTKTSMKAGKKLLSLASLASGDLFDNVYKLSTKKETNDDGTYYILLVEKYDTVGSLEDPMTNEIEALYAMLSTQGYKVDFEDQSTSDSVEDGDFTTAEESNPFDA